MEVLTRVLQSRRESTVEEGEIVDTDPVPVSCEHTGPMDKIVIEMANIETSRTLNTLPHLLPIPPESLSHRCVDFPILDLPRLKIFRRLASDLIAWASTTRSPDLKENHYPRDCTGWAIVSSAGTLCPPHTEANGLATLIKMEIGTKIFTFGRQKAGKCFGIPSLHNVDGVSDGIQGGIKYSKQLLDNMDVVSILVPPGSEL